MQVADADTVKREFAFVGEEEGLDAPSGIKAAFNRTQSGSLMPGVGKYHKFWDCADKKGYSGTAILSVSISIWCCACAPCVAVIDQHCASWQLQARDRAIEES